MGCEKVNVHKRYTGNAAKADKQQIGETTSPHALWALAKALGALPVKLTEAQAQQALDPLLQRISKTTSAGEFGYLAYGLEARLLSSSSFARHSYFSVSNSRIGIEKRSPCSSISSIVPK